MLDSKISSVEQRLGASSKPDVRVCFIALCGSGFTAEARRTRRRCFGPVMLLRSFLSQRELEVAPPRPLRLRGEYPDPATQALRMFRQQVPFALSRKCSEVEPHDATVFLSCDGVAPAGLRTRRSARPTSRPSFTTNTSTRFRSAFPSPGSAQTPEANVSIYRSDSDLPLIPASNLKLLTTSAFLDRLGGGLQISHQPARQGRRLYLIGDGDPTLRRRRPAQKARLGCHHRLQSLGRRADQARHDDGAQCLSSTTACSISNSRRSIGWLKQFQREIRRPDRRRESQRQLRRFLGQSDHARPAGELRAGSADALCDACETSASPAIQHRRHHSTGGEKRSASCAAK